MSGKKITRRSFVSKSSGTFVAATGIFAPNILRAQPRVLSMSSWLPPTSIMVPFLFQTWADEVQRVTEGRVEVQLLDKPLGPPPAHFDLVKSGKADIGYALHGYSGDDAFVRAQIGQLSFLGDAYTASHSFSKVYRGFLGAEEEHEGVKLLGVYQHGPGMLMLRNKEVRAPEDFEGLRIRTSGGYISQLMSSVGAENVPMSPLQVKEALLNGTIDGVMFPYEGGDAFQITEQITSITEVPGGFYNASWFLAMSENVWESLPERDQVLIDDLSREICHVLAAKAFYIADDVGIKKFKALGTVVNEADEELLGYLRGKADLFDAAWVQRVSEMGYDGKEALRVMRDAV
ncbi:TRAP transporter substrate-binding protein [Algicella marina]|uniref:ABC transporter substrate-binding protein n=1 Tax=Algicella marina TaxID=2683284 RepID=A0A6P1SYP8_9RHOB|nr:TRAP transporter substrate-binding protein [Algicella marina]QHQ34867.1 ABC transporter substrate-binding protein [Algicella marina]